MHGFAMLILFSFLLAHPTSQQYDTQQLWWEGRFGVDMMHLSALNMTSACNKPFENRKFRENVMSVSLQLIML